MVVAAAHDLERPGAGPSEGGFHLAPLIARIADNALDKGEGPSGFAEQAFGSVSILNARRVDDDREKEPKGIRQDVALAANNLLARIIAGRVERAPLWGLPSRSGCR